MTRKKQKPEPQDAALEAFLAFLRRKGDRVTRSRKVIFSRVMERHDHFRADDLASELAAGSERVSRGTVYRTLALMEEAGFVRTMRDGGAHRHYEHTYGHTHHDHMVCEQCGCFVEFFDEAVQQGIERACRGQRFKQREHRLVIFGTCAACQRSVRQGARSEGRA